jgi:hypothetical protein
MKFLRTASTGRLLATILGLVAAVAAGTAIAVAATSAGPVPKSKPLASALHDALSAKPVQGITADITFTNHLIGSADFTGDTVDPLLQGATGRLWLSNDHRLRLELQSDNGDSQIMVNRSSFWISDAQSHTVYEGTLPGAATSGSTAKSRSTKQAGTSKGLPTIAQIQTDLNRLLRRVNVTGTRTSNPTDVGGRPAYSVVISPKHDGGQLGSLQLAWDAIKGIPLDIGVYARNSTTPVLELKATNISYGAVSSSDLAVSPPAGDKVVKVSSAGHAASPLTGNAKVAKGKAAKARARARKVSGVAAVARQLPFTLVAPKSLVGLPRHGTTLLDWSGKPAALITYGENLGGVAVIEQSAGAGSAKSSSSSTSGGDPGSGLAMPTVSINGATGQELDTALGTLVRFTRGGVAYTVVGSVTPYAADTAARALTP